MLDVTAGDYIRELILRVDGIREVWLIGSRANGFAQQDSDWDFLVFADLTMMGGIAKDSMPHADNIDLLLVDSDGNFMRPWADSKSGSLTSWRWRRIDRTTAEYEGAKWVSDQEALNSGIYTLGTIKRNVFKAYLVWSNDGPS
jgi:hypothetical protein